MSGDPVAALIVSARQFLLMRKEGGALVDRGAIEQVVQLVVPTAGAATGRSYSADEIATAIRSLETIFVVEQGPSISLTDRSRPPEWYVGERRKPGPFMERYLQKLEESDWADESVRQLRESTARVLEVLDDPDRLGPWDWRGLVVGDVQSGKTAHYAGVINRAADAGYRVIVVLAGMHNVLRLQTQKRLDKDFLGYDTDPKSFSDTGRRIPIGVGRINPRLIVDSLTVSSIGGDFSQKVANQANFAPLSQPCLLVVKKQGKVLQNLNRWIKRLPDESRAAPLLVIDDEADQASVDTGDQPLLPDGTFDEDYDPKRINGEIRKLLYAFERSAYVAYTATPFANILMHDERRAQDYGADLFPATFIVSLTPPDDYFGPAAVFGTNDEGDDEGLPLIRHVDQTAEAWIPDKHDRTLVPRFDGQDAIPPSLERSIDAFLLACASRAARGQGREHNSMLIHVSRFVDVHQVVHRQVEAYLVNTRALVSGGDRETIDRLHRMWLEDFEPAADELAPTVFGRQTIRSAWSQVLDFLPDSSDKIQVILANGKSKNDIDYDSYKETGRSVIAVGGDKLSRGLTLEGLTVSYFLRIARQYDSLLQMGRWFGYRRGFADVCRLYTTPDMEDWFTHVATANKELRSEFIHMQQTGATPKEYGLRVEGHSILNVTAPGKQRHATPRQVSFAGEGKIQTVMFRDKGLVEQNAAATDAFVESLGQGRDSPVRPGSAGKTAKGELWSNVSGRAIAEFLSGLAFPPESLQIEGGKLAQYIRAQITQNELTEWTVFLPGADGRTVSVGGRQIKSVKRTPRDEGAEDRYIVKTILSPFDEAIDLTEDEFTAALAETNSERQAVSKPATDRPSGPSIRDLRGRRPQNGLLIIYPLDPSVPKMDTDRPVIGVVVSFPDSPTARRRLYLENTVRSREEQE
ncbi:Z1 domain-containing protein [Bradyrhizobium sp. AZCC 2289]|uniref:Z1 domain-containing protein n=1 Tax=Bradyrhizobium sp. AZCC 2289 TaxID=3117026 RepID=UPI002FF251B1